MNEELKEELHWPHIYWSKKELTSGDKDKFEEHLRKIAEDLNLINSK